MVQKNKADNNLEPLWTGDKEVYVRSMFSSIAPRYDLMNSVLSMRRHHAWRRLTVKLAQALPGDTCLDVCTGTGDFARELANAVGPQGKIVGADFCAPMIEAGMGRRPLQARMIVANAEFLPLPADTFDVVTVGFGVRNVACLDRAVQEMARVAKPGGRVAILEFNRPRPVWYRPFIDFYLFHVLPRIGGLFSRQEAYVYLPESMKRFVSREELVQKMACAGLQDICVRDLNFGTVCIHMGVKPYAASKGEGK